jgi:cytochrome c
MGVWSRLISLEPPRWKRVDSARNRHGTERDMFDTMTLTKTVGALCGMLLVFLLGKWAAEGIYHMGGGHGYGEEHHQAYPSPPTKDGCRRGAGRERGPTFEEVLARRPISIPGERVFRACQACHKLEAGANAPAPICTASSGARSARRTGFNIPARCPRRPRSGRPRTSTRFSRTRAAGPRGPAWPITAWHDVEDRANLIAYLDSLDD